MNHGGVRRVEVGRAYVEEGERDPGLTCTQHPGPVPCCIPSGPQETREGFHQARPVS